MENRFEVVKIDGGSSTVCNLDHPHFQRLDLSIVRVEIKSCTDEGFGTPCIVEDESHCEFVKLRDFLTRTHLQDLIETTSEIHYEAFRSKQLVALKDSTAATYAGSRPISPADRELSRQSHRATLNGYGP